MAKKKCMILLREKTDDVMWYLQMQRFTLLIQEIIILLFIAISLFISVYFKGGLYWIISGVVIIAGLTRTLYDIIGYRLLLQKFSLSPC
jgi:hypothetical protein